MSSSCTCTPAVTYIYGCTDSNAKNYNSSANKDNGSYTYGYTDKEASNYNSNAEKDDGSCEYLTFDNGAGDIKGIDVVVNDNNLEATSEGNPFLSLLVIGAGGYGIYKFAKRKNKKIEIS